MYCIACYKSNWEVYDLLILMHKEQVCLVNQCFSFLLLSILVIFIFRLLIYSLEELIMLAYGIVLSQLI